MSKRYSYEMRGTAADGQSWRTEGSVEIANPGDFPGLAMMALRDTFDRLTQGRPVYGLPGVGCRGPYQIDELLLKRDE